MEKVKAPVYMAWKPQAKVPSGDRRMPASVSCSSTVREDLSGRMSPRGAAAAAHMSVSASKARRRVGRKKGGVVSMVASKDYLS